MDGFPSQDRGAMTPAFDDPFSFSDLINFEGYAELCCPSGHDQEFVPFSAGNVQLGQGMSSMFGDQIQKGDDAVRDSDRQLMNLRTGYSGDVAKLGVSGNGFSYLQSSSGFERMDGLLGLGTAGSEMVCRTSVIPRSMNYSFSLPDKMSRVLQYLKDPSGVLAQFWVPVKHGERYVLSTHQQPHVLDQSLAGYREVSRRFVFSADEGPGLRLGLPGRVFVSGMLEWTSDVVYYKEEEYLRVNHARDHRIRASIAVPVFDPADNSCCAVLELVTVKEKPTLDSEMESLCMALQAVNLMTANPRTQQQSLTRNQINVFAEIADVVQAACHAHMLPLALTWVPTYNGESNSFYKRNAAQERSNLWKGCMLHLQESACYVNDVHMQGFVHACAKHILKEGRGIAGKALQSNHPFFCPDVKCYDIYEYPLAHHARKFGLHAAVAVRLRSTCTGDDDYIVEFFLPVDCVNSSEQQRLLGNLSNTMQRVCRSLRTVSDAEIVMDNSISVEFQRGQSHQPSSDESPGHPCSSVKIDQNPSRKPCDDVVGSKVQEKILSEPKRNLEKKRSTTEKHISLTVLQQYFSGSLKDAAKGIGVCPTTLKRICRQHGISRWPSRKINKVNRSLKKIKTVIESVQGVDGAIKYDPVSGNLVAAVTPSENAISTPSDPGPRDSMHASSINSHQFLQRSSKMGASMSAIVRRLPAGEVLIFKTDSEEGRSFTSAGHTIHNGQDDARGLSRSAFESKDASIGLQFLKERGAQVALAKAQPEQEVLNQHMIPINRTLVMSDDLISGNNMMAENNNPTSSATTDSSNGSDLSFPPAKNYADSMDHTGIRSPTITVKATYKNDTVRFKFAPTLGCLQLLEEIGRRFRLARGSFQLKYMDDEDEWVMLTSDADLQECLEIMESLSLHSVKLLVREIPIMVSSSASSNCIS